MDIYAYLYILLMLLLTAFAVISIIWLESNWKRYVLCAFFPFILGCGLLFLPGILGLPKPVFLEWRYRNLEDATVLSALISEGEGIYVLLIWDNFPRYYVYPWDQALGEQLARTQQEARESGKELHVLYPFRGDIRLRAKKTPSNISGESSAYETSPRELEDVPMFYAKPQPRLPDKPQVEYRDFAGEVVDPANMRPESLSVEGGNTLSIPLDYRMNWGQGISYPLFSPPPAFGPDMNLREVPSN